MRYKNLIPGNFLKDYLKLNIAFFFMLIYDYVINFVQLYHDYIID